MTHELSGDITAFKSLPSDVRAHIMQDCAWRSSEWGLHSRPVAPPAHAPRIRSDKWVAPAGPTEEELEAERRAEERRQKLIQSGRLKSLMARIAGNTVGTAFIEWRRNAKRQRTYRYGRDRMRWIYARLSTRGRLLSRGFLGWWSHSHYQMKRRNLIACGLNRWRQMEASKAINRWKEWLDIKFRGMDLVRRVAMRIRNQSVARCWGAWVQVLRDKQEQQEKIKRMLATMMGNALQYYFSTWHDNVKFLLDPDAQMGDKEVLETFYAVGKVTVNKRFVVPASDSENEQEFLVQLGESEVWLPRSALSLCSSHLDTGQHRLEVGAIVKLVDSKTQLKLAFRALGSSSTVEMTRAKAALCGCEGKVIAPDMGDGTLKVEFSGNGQDEQTPEVGNAGWYPASALELVRPARGSSAGSSSSSSESIEVGSRVRVRRGARATLPADAQAAGESCRYAGKVLAVPEPALGLVGMLPAHGGCEGGGYIDPAGGTGTIDDFAQLGKQLVAGVSAGWPRRRRSSSSRDGSRRSSQHAQGASSLLPAVEADRERRRASRRKQQRGPQSRGQRALFDLHLDRPLSRVADNLGMHYARRAAHVLNAPPPRDGDGAPSQIVGLRMKSLFGDTSGGASSGEMLRG